MGITVKNNKQVTNYTMIKDTSFLKNADTTENDVLAGKTFYAGDGNLKTGTIETYDGSVNIVKNGVLEVGGKYVATDLTIDVGGDNNLLVSLPNKFLNSTYIYYFKVSEDKYLFSSNTTDIGVWLYNITTSTFTQLYTIGTSWKFFQMVGTNCLISSETYSNAGVLLYNSQTENIVQIYNSGKNWRYFHLLNNDCIISSYDSNTGMLLYDGESKTVSQKYSEGTSYQYSQIISNNKMLIANNLDAMYLYDAETKTITQKYVGTSTKNTGRKIFQLINNDYLIGTNGQGTYDQGVLLYNSENDTVTKIYEDGERWEYFQEVDNKCLIGCWNSSNAGLLLYDAETKTIQQIYNTGWFDSFFLVNNDCLMCQGNTNTLWLYNGVTGTIQQLYTTSISSINYALVTGGALIAHSNGVLLYDIETKTINSLYSAGLQRSILLNIKNDYLISAYSPNLFTGILLFNDINKTISQLSNLGGTYSEAIEDGNIYRILSTNTNEQYNSYVLYYDSVNKQLIDTKYKIIISE